MAFNPKLMLHARELFSRFREHHPKVLPFFRDAGSRLEEGTVIEMKVTTPDGRQICSNIRVTREDMELLEEVRQMKGE